MDIKFTPSELGLLMGLIQEKETIEDVLHRLLEPMVVHSSEERLQRLADAYRGLSPDLQLEAIQVLEEWQRKKFPDMAQSILSLTR